jgi:hypothetical protein
VFVETPKKKKTKDLSPDSRSPTEIRVGFLVRPLTNVHIRMGIFVRIEAFVRFRFEGRSYIIRV